MSGRRAPKPSPRVREEGAEDRRSEAGEEEPGYCPSPGRRCASSDLSPQAGRGEESTS